MKTKFISIAATLLLAASFNTVLATTPIAYYLVGSEIGWEEQSKYQFEYDAQNDVFTLTCAISGEFKIRSGNTWYGSYQYENDNHYLYYNHPTVTLNTNGDNKNLYLLRELTYTFTFNPSNNELTVSGFNLYIVGDFNEWTPEQMTYNNGTYSIEKTLKAGDKFKFRDWSDKDDQGNRFYGGDVRPNTGDYGIHNDWHTNIPLTEGDLGKDFIINRAGTYTFIVNSNRQLSVEGFPPLVSISEDEAEQDIINTLNYYKSYGEEVDFVMTGRTIYMHQWNTICLPFSLTNAQLQLTFLKEYTIKKMSGSSLGADGTLNLNFESQNAITAGVPYLIYCGKSGASDLYEPRFDNVVIDRSSADYFPHFPDESDFYASFIGTFVPYQLEAGPDKYYYLGENSTLYYPSEAVTVGPFRAYFQVTFPESSGAGIKSYCLNFDDETTSIQEISNTSNTSNAIYTLDGRRINGQPATAGLYIINGKKVMIK